MVSQLYCRPRTRGELMNKLSDGIDCEVAADVAEMTASMLRGWLEFKEFTVRPSCNKGWMIFESTATKQKAERHESMQ